MIFDVKTFDFDRKTIRIFLNGEVVRRVFYADTFLGMVRHYDDPPVINHNRDAAVSHEASGVVTFEIEDR